MKRIIFIVLGVVLLGAVAFGVLSCPKKSYTLTVTVPGEGGTAGRYFTTGYRASEDEPYYVLEETTDEYAGFTIELLAVPESDDYRFRRWTTTDPRVVIVPDTVIVADGEVRNLSSFKMPKGDVSIAAEFYNPWLDYYPTAPTAKLTGEFADYSFYFIDAKSGQRLNYETLTVNGKVVVDAECMYTTVKGNHVPIVTFTPEESILRKNGDTITYALDENGEIAGRIVYTTRSVLKYELNGTTLSISEVKE